MQHTSNAGKKFTQKNRYNDNVLERPFPTSPFKKRLDSLLSDFSSMRDDAKVDDGRFLEFVANELESAGEKAVECLNIDINIYRNRLEACADNMLVKDYRKLDDELRREYQSARLAVDASIAKTVEWVKKQHCSLTYSWYGNVVGNKPLWDVFYCTLFDRAASSFEEEVPRGVSEFLPRHFSDILDKVEDLLSDNSDLYKAMDGFFVSKKKK